MKINYYFIKFDLGYLLLLKNERRLFLVKYFKEYNSLEKWLEDQANLSTHNFTFQPSFFSKEEKFLNSYLGGKKIDFSKLKFDISSGTEWQKKVWIETQKIPYGETRSYKYISEKLNSKAFRSVGKALGKNPLLIIIPCHRVINKNGMLGGFSAGLDLKKYLLSLEGIKI